MQVNMRREHRRKSSASYQIAWQDGNGKSYTAQASGVDLSDSGLRLRCLVGLQPGSTIYIEAKDGHLTGYGVVRHCQPREAGYVIGIELQESSRRTEGSASNDSSDYYEFLQISPKAEFATIHRVYRFMASRFHPDNPETGDSEKFLMLKRAYEVLSDPDRRAEYDASHQGKEARPIPIFESGVFVNGIEGEMNRRLGVLSVLYNRRRSSVETPSVSLIDLEKTMGFPREYLDFTTWYLKSKGFITIADNSDFCLTALGVDYVEENVSRIPILKKLLNAGPRTTTSNEKTDDPPDAVPFVLGPPDIPPASGFVEDDLAPAAARKRS